MQLTHHTVINQCALSQQDNKKNLPKLKVKQLVHVPTLLSVTNPEIYIHKLI